jgi:hypothetical protein
MGDEIGGAGVDVAEPVLVRGERLISAKARGAAQGCEIRGQRVAVVSPVHADVGADAGQQVVAGQQDAGRGIVQAQMTGSMSRGPDGPDIAARYGHAVAVAQEPVRFGQVQNVGDPILVHGEDSEILVRDSVAAQPVLISASLTLAVTPQPARKGLGFHRMHRDPRPAFAAEPAAQAVMVGVNVGDHHARDVVQPRARGAEAGGNGLAAGRGVPAGIHDHDARVADERVGQGVPQRTVRDGDRHRPQVRADLFHRQKHAPLPRVLLRGAGDVDAADRAEVGCQGHLPLGAGTATARSRKLTSRAA